MDVSCGGYECEENFQNKKRIVDVAVDKGAENNWIYFTDIQQEFKEKHNRELTDAVRVRGTVIHSD